VLADEALLPDDLIKRQTHDSFPCLDPWTRDGAVPGSRVSQPGTASQQHRPLIHACT